ncbi:MAG: universal stress protein [Cognatishimia sp.]
MSIKNILCAYSGEEAHGSGLVHAFKLARHHDAWLTGILRHSPNFLERRYAAQTPEALLERLREADQERIKEIRERFAATVEKAGLDDKCDFVELDEDFEGGISEYARSFDLVVTGVHSAALSDEHMSAHPDLIALRSGRPVLIVPNDYEAAGLADHALVAWDGKRSAARALGDAMPILEEKAKVTILTVGNKQDEGMDVMLRNLQRHGIETHHMVVPRKGSVGATILRVAKEVSAKLLVMGAYEHSKFSHKIIGGATTDVLAETDIPVFMSH